MRECVGQVAPRELAERLAQPHTPLLVDVRELEEYQFCRLAGAVHLPMSQLGQRYKQLDCEREMVVYCHHGIRSQIAAEFLSQQGCRRVYNLVGGIDAWSAEIDPNVPRY